MLIFYCDDHTELLFLHQENRDINMDTRKKHLTVGFIEEE